MGQITGGSYGRTVNIGDYNSKKAEIAFSVDEGEDPAVAAQEAVLLCHKILFTISAGASSRSDTQSQSVSTGSTETASAEASTDQPAPKPRGKGGRPPKSTAPNLDPTDTRATAASSANQGNAASTPTASTPTTTSDAAAVVEDPPAAEAGAVADPAAISDEDLFSPAAPEITDVDLTKAVTKANTDAASLAAIRKLIGEFVALPKKLTDIPQGERPRFLEKLAALKAV